jgi:hypothetical protein
VGDVRALLRLFELGIVGVMLVESHPKFADVIVPEIFL